MKKIDTACIVDDDSIFTYGVKKLMEISNFCERILVFHNGLDAIQHIKVLINNKETLPEVLLLDLNMPIMDGWQFLDEIIKIEPANSITIFIVSSSIDSHDHEKALEYKRISKFIIKPILKSDLEKILTEFNKPTL
ncbi:response regulator [Flavobacterium sp. '19STA2R22 D10 B1']|uniref:response regulator n=1 Tax=Flavobacterium aerium TaxID=3037261 RepID=UPI00278C0384|nr:response regulator [Flavobacterium sp. '19STA2R22 D10 B1']